MTQHSALKELTRCFGEHKEVSDGRYIKDKQLYTVGKSARKMGLSLDEAVKHYTDERDKDLIKMGWQSEC